MLEHDLGYHLYRSVERAKVELSDRDVARFAFSEAPVVIDAEIARSQFEAWVAEEIQAMAEAVNRLLEQTGATSSDVDRVFMTGGASFVPAVRRVFDERFGHAKNPSGRRG